MRDVVIIGGGPAGTLLALLLVRRGIDVGILEQRTTVSKRARAIGIHPPAARVLRGCGAGLDGATTISSGTARDGDRVLSRIDFPEPVLSIPQHELERELRELLHAEAPDALSSGIAARVVRQHRDGVVVETDRGTVQSRLAVAADGVESAIRSQAGIGWRTMPGRGDYLMADVEDTTEFGDEAALWFVAGGVVESFPMPNGRRRWVARVAPADGSDLSRVVAERTGISVPASALETSRFTATQHLASRWVDGRLVLLGDAAHEVSPIGGQGMNLGLLDAALLASAVTSGPVLDARSLGEWEAARRRSARRAIAQACFNMAMGVRAPRTVQPFRRGAIRALSVPAMRKRLADAFTMTHL